MLPQKIALDQVGTVIAQAFKGRDEIVCYLGSNAATPTASIEALTESIKSRNPKLPFIHMVHLLLQGPVPYVEAGLQDRVMAYSIFSGGEVRQAANEGRAFYLPCTLANLDSLIGKGRKYEPDVVVLKVCRNEFTGEFSLGLSVEALHTAIDHAKVVIAELDPSMPFTQGQSVVDAQSIDYIIEAGVKPVYAFNAPDFETLAPEKIRIGELIPRHFIKDGVTLRRMNDDGPLGLKTVRRSLLIGLVLSLALTLIVTSMELIENPGGVFRQDEGVHWPNTLETVWSWFYPTFLLASLIAFLFIGGVALIRQRHSKNTQI